MSQLVQMTEDEFDATYALLANHLNKNASWSFGEGAGCLFEPHGEELEFVRRQSPDTVWTLVDGDDGDLYVINYYHLVNRIGYLISIVPVPEGTAIEVHIPCGEDVGDGQ